MRRLLVLLICRDELHGHGWARHSIGGVQDGLGIHGWATLVSLRAAIKLPK